MYTFIVNPNARSGLGMQIWTELQGTLEQRKIQYEVCLTRSRNHAFHFTKALTGDGKEHMIIAMGGDGTVNEVINGIQDYSKVTFGYIPIGSSNDFARGLSLTGDPGRALNVVLDIPHIEEIDVGSITYGMKTRKFAVSSGIGFDAAICHEAMVSRIKVFLNRIGLGKLTYAGIALHRILFDAPVRINIQTDQGDTVTFEQAYFAAVMNLPYEGGGFKFCPQARCNDGQLDILVIANMSKFKILALLPTAFKGWHVRFKGVYTYRCREVSIETSKALPVHTDGEAVFLKRQIHVSCAPQKLRMILPGPITQ